MATRQDGFWKRVESSTGAMLWLAAFMTVVGMLGFPEARQWFVSQHRIPGFVVVMLGLLAPIGAVRLWAILRIDGTAQEAAGFARARFVRMNFHDVDWTWKWSGGDVDDLAAFCVADQTRLQIRRFDDGSVALYCVACDRSWLRRPTAESISLLARSEIDRRMVTSEWREGTRVHIE